MLTSQFCSDEDDIRTPRLHFTYVFDVDFIYIDWHYQFRCNYDECNNELNVNNTINTFQKAYNIRSILKVFGYKDDGEGKETGATSTSIKTSYSQQPTNSVRSSTITNPVASTTVTNPVASTTITNPVASTTVTNPVASTTVTNSVASTTVTNPVASTTVTNTVASATVTNPVASTTVTNTVASTTVTNTVASTTVTNTVASTTITNPATKSDINGTDTTTKTNHGLHLQSGNTITYITLIIVSGWIFLT